MRSLWVVLLGLTGCMEQEYALISMMDSSVGALPALLNSHGGVRGRVCAPSGATWVSGASVWVTLEDGTVMQTKTDGDGWYNLGDVPPGKFTVRVKKGSFTTSFPATVEKDVWTVLASETCLTSNVQVAVVTGEYDHVESVLDTLGVSYDVYDGLFESDDYVELLRDRNKLATYDVVFFNCGMSTNWLDYEEEITGHIREFVADGGSIYASDWAYYVLERSFPDLIDFYGDDTVSGAAALGESGVYAAKVEDASLKSLLGGNTVDLTFDLGSWVVPKSTSGEDVLITGGVQVMDTSGTTTTVHAPLVIQAERGGNVLYTSFHTEHQSTVDMEAILEQMVLSL